LAVTAEYKEMAIWRIHGFCNITTQCNWKFDWLSSSVKRHIDDVWLPCTIVIDILVLCFHVVRQNNTLMWQTIISFLFRIFYWLSFCNRSKIGPPRPGLHLVSVQ
jgi:hypothetical protein